ncbi:hypothetical protein BVRB_2g035590 [Beta vulgaris subsp. vulgaris]|nr:hypothetical protein BVRB_2g035590 [Beta vulgaris subsp. vulgaris]
MSSAAIPSHRALRHLSLPPVTALLPTTSDPPSPLTHSFLPLAQPPAAPFLSQTHLRRASTTKETTFAVPPPRPSPSAALQPPFPAKRVSSHPLCPCRKSIWAVQSIAAEHSPIEAATGLETTGPEQSPEARTTVASRQYQSRVGSPSRRSENPTAATGGALMEDGFPADKLFNQGYSYTYDDVIFLTHYIDFSTDSVDLNCKLTKNISLSIPCVSSPMDTVTESYMAVAMASLGGVGILHSNNTPSEQFSLLKSVKSRRIPFVLLKKKKMHYTLVLFTYAFITWNPS